MWFDQNVKFLLHFPGVSHFATCISSHLPKGITFDAIIANNLNVLALCYFWLLARKIDQFTNIASKCIHLAFSSLLLNSCKRCFPASLNQVEDPLYYMVKCICLLRMLWYSWLLMSSFIWVSATAEMTLLNPSLMKFMSFGDREVFVNIANARDYTRSTTASLIHNIFGFLVLLWPNRFAIAWQAVYLLLIICPRNNNELSNQRLISVP